MKIKATKSFSGLVTMRAGEERNVRDGIANDLIRAGYATRAETAATPPGGGKKTNAEESGQEAPA